MIPYQHIHTYGANDKTWLSALSDLSIATIEGQPYLFTVTQQHGGGVTVYRPDAVTGLLSRVDTQGFPAGTTYQGQPEISLFNNGINDYLYLTDLGNSEYLALSLSESGRLDDYETIVSSDQHKTVTAFGEFETPQGRFLYSAYLHDLSIHITKIEDDGRLTHHSSVKIPLPYPHEHASVDRLFVAHAAGKKYIIAISGLGDFIAAYEIKETGELITGSLHTGNMGIGYKIPTDAIAAEVAGESYIIVASPGSSSLTVLKLGLDGKLNAVDHVPDTLNTRFERITTIDSVVLDGRTFIFVGGTDDGISVFTLQPGGILLHLQSIADLDDLTLKQVSDIAAIVHDGKLEVFISSGHETGITQLRFDPGKIGRTDLTSHLNARGTIENDLLISAPGGRNLYGREGDDILISRDAGIRLHGGPGSDIFVPTGAEGTITIQDFEPGIDYIDLSQLRVATSTYDLRMTITDSFAVLRRMDTKIVIKTKDGVPFQEGDITNSNFVISHYDTPEQEPVFLPRPTAEELLHPYLLGEFPEEHPFPDPLIDAHSSSATLSSADRVTRYQDEPHTAPKASCFALTDLVSEKLLAIHPANMETVGKTVFEPYTTEAQDDVFIFTAAGSGSIESKYSDHTFKQTGTTLFSVATPEFNREYQLNALPDQSPEGVLSDMISDEIPHNETGLHALWPLSDSDFLL